MGGWILGINLQLERFLGDLVDFWLASLCEIFRDSSCACLLFIKFSYES